jgi:hypothetical protein
MKKSFLYEFYGVSLSKSSHTITNGQKVELGKVYSDPFARAFGKIKEDVEEDDVDEYDVDSEYEDELSDFISFLKTKMKEKDAYNESLNEAEYQGKSVKLGKPMQGDVKKFKVYVKNPAGKVIKVNFGQKGMVIKKNNPERRKSFRARMHCDTNPGPRTKANYWSCKKW